MSTDAVPAAKEFPKDKEFEEGDARYFPGGFHPVRLGEVYNSRYEVLQKLGYGRYSTVWLVKNQVWVNLVKSSHAVSSPESNDITETGSSGL